MSFVYLILGIIFLLIVFNLKSKKAPTTSAIEEKKEIMLPDFATRDETTGNVSLSFTFEDSLYKEGHYLVFDIETSGLPKSKGIHPEFSENFPRVLQVAWKLFDEYGDIISSDDRYLKQTAKIPASATLINGIDDAKIKELGEDHSVVFSDFIDDIKNCKVVVCHNAEFDIPIMESEFLRNGFKKQFSKKKKICTMKLGTNICCLDKDYGRGYKYPKLEELFKYLFFRDAVYFKMDGLHNASLDVSVTAKCLFELKGLGYIKY